MAISFVLSLLVCIGTGQALVLSKSQIKTCERTEKETNCTESLYVQLSLQNGQGFGEELSFNVSKFEDQNGREVSLDSPLVVSLMKSNVEVSYNTLYRQDVNTNPVEKVIDSNYFSCSEGLYLGSLQLSSSTCTLARDSRGNVIPNSQGYCCSCPILTYLAGVRPAGTTRNDCGFLSNSMSASCLSFPNQWHSLYEVTNYQYNYFITAQMRIRTKTGGEQTSDMVISNSQKSASNGIFQVSIVGDFNPSNPPPNLSDKYLLRPRIPVSETTPTQNWLLVDKNMVTLDGSECNKIGISYSAFQDQPNKCQRPAGSCTGNQISQLIDSDNKRRAAGMQPNYQLDRYGQFSSVSSPNGSFKLNYLLNSDMPTMVSLVINSTDMVYALNVATGNISQTKIVEFEGMTTYGQLNVTVVSTSSLTANFELALNCTSGIKNVSSRSLTLSGSANTTVSFSIYTSTQLRANHSCTARLLNSKGTVVDQKLVSFATAETNITLPQMSANQTSLGQVDSSSQSPTLTLVDCDVICPGQLGLGCRLTFQCPMTPTLLVLFFLCLVACVTVVSLCCCPQTFISCVKKSACICRRQHNNPPVPEEQDDLQDNSVTKVAPKRACCLKPFYFIKDLLCGVIGCLCCCKCLKKKQMPKKRDVHQTQQGDHRSYPEQKHPNKSDDAYRKRILSAEELDVEMKPQTQVGVTPSPASSESRSTGFLNFTNKSMLGVHFQSRFHCRCLVVHSINSEGHVQYVPEEAFGSLFPHVSPIDLQDYIAELLGNNTAILTRERPMYPTRVSKLLINR